ncbi:SGNH/GDSL hydrolase family protein [Microbacterium sp. SORGH_AS_0505]|uniref:SGNH/GDSL hydrolase family protein n=1 Tax=Microbacterium sp. SORGH_AS_0505 TaxID=3041770 RepID=UPI0027D78DCB|nr:SGNH/GDSL hydrolase family protein [Microbacterium sp. SORGH_AS_0505]
MSQHEQALAAAAAKAQAYTYVASEPPPATRDRVTAYVIGDSIVGGAGTGGNPVTPGARMGSILNWSVKNDGIGGSGFVAFGRQLNPGVEVDRSLGTRLDDVLKSKPDVVIVAAGRNDRGEDLEVVKSRMQSFFKDLRKGLPNATIVAVSPWIWDIPEDHEAQPAIEEITEDLRDTAQSVGAIFVDSRTQLWGVTPDTVATMTSADGWHPNSAGYINIGRDLARVLVDDGLPRGPERWVETAPLSGEYYDASDEFFDGD